MMLGAPSSRGARLVTLLHQLSCTGGAATRVTLVFARPVRAERGLQGWRTPCRGGSRGLLGQLAPRGMCTAAAAGASIGVVMAMLPGRPAAAEAVRLPAPGAELSKRFEEDVVARVAVAKRAPSGGKLALTWEVARPDAGLLVVAAAASVAAAWVNVQISVSFGKISDIVAGLGAAATAAPAADALLAQLQPAAATMLALYLAHAGLTAAYISFMSLVGERVAARCATHGGQLSRARGTLWRARCYCGRGR